MFICDDERERRRGQIVMTSMNVGPASPPFACGVGCHIRDVGGSSLGFFPIVSRMSGAAENPKLEARKLSTAVF